MYSNTTSTVCIILCKPTYLFYEAINQSTISSPGAPCEPSFVEGGKLYISYPLDPQTSHYNAHTRIYRAARTTLKSNFGHTSIKQF